MNIISLLLIMPIIGLFTTAFAYESVSSSVKTLISKQISLITSILTLMLTIIMFSYYNDSTIIYQFVNEINENGVLGYNLCFGVDGTSMYFVILTVIIMPIAQLSNWVSIWFKESSFINITGLLLTLLLSIFLVLDGLMFYVFFESILPPLFLLIGLFGSTNKVRAAFYLFLYTLLGSLFMLLSILTMSSTIGCVDYHAMSKSNILYSYQLIIFIGIMIAFAVKTPTIIVNIWLLKAHVESPLSGSIILAAIVLKLSLYGIFRLILPILAKASVVSTHVIFFIGVLTIIIASLSTIRTVDIKELIAYSSVCHAAVYLLSAFSNTLAGIEGSILLGLAHGFVSSGLFICAGGVLYDRTGTRLINYYKGMAQIMPVFAVLFFLLCLGNCGAPLTVNFLGEFLSLYGVFSRHPILGALASVSIIFSAAYTIYLYNRISFGGTYGKHFYVNLPDVNKRETSMILTLVLAMIILGIYPSPILNGMHYSVSTLLY